MGYNKTETTQRQNWLGYICITNSKKHLTHQKMISSSLFRKIDMNVYSVKSSLGMIWNAMGTLKAPKIKGAHFFWAARGTRLALEADEWLQIQERVGSWFSIKGNAALLVRVVAVHPAEVKGSSGSGIAERRQQEEIWLSQWRGLVWWAAGEETLPYV